MECPHCGSEFEGKSHVFALGEDPDGSWQVLSAEHVFRDYQYSVDGKVALPA